MREWAGYYKVESVYPCTRLNPLAGHTGLVIKTNKTSNVSERRGGGGGGGVALAPLNGTSECGQTFESEIESCARPTTTTRPTGSQ